MEGELGLILSFGKSFQNENCSIFNDNWLYIMIIQKNYISMKNHQYDIMYTQVSLCGASADTRGSKGKKRYNTGNRAGYSTTLDAAGMAHFFSM